MSRVIILREDGSYEVVPDINNPGDTTVLFGYEFPADPEALSAPPFSFLMNENGVAKLTRLSDIESVLPHIQYPILNQKIGTIGNNVIIASGWLGKAILSDQVTFNEDEPVSIDERILIHAGNGKLRNATSGELANLLLTTPGIYIAAENGAADELVLVHPYKQNGSAPNKSAFTMETVIVGSENIGKLVANINNKCDLLNLEQTNEAQRGRWKLDVANVPQKFQQRIVDIDFTGVENSDFQEAPTTVIYLGEYYDDGAFIFTPGTPPGEDAFTLGATIDDTIDNIVSTMQAFYAARNGSGLIRTVQRIGKVVRVGMCDPTSTFFRPAQDGLNVHATGFSVNSPTISDYQSYMRGFEDAPVSGTIFYYDLESGNMTLYIHDILQQPIGMQSTEWGLYFPNSVEPFVQQIADMLYDYFIIIERNSLTVTFEEPTDPTNYNVLTLNANPGFNICSLTEITQSKPISTGAINGLMLSELIALEGDTATINTDEIIGLVCVESVNAGDLVTPTTYGSVRKITKDEGDNIFEKSFVFVALTSGTKIKGRLLNPILLSMLNNNTGSSSYGSSAGETTEVLRDVTWFLALQSPTIDSFIQFYDGVGSYKDVQIDTDTTGYLLGSVTPSYWALLVNTNDGNRMTVKDMFNTIDYVDDLSGGFKFLTNTDADLLFTPDNGTTIFTLAYGFF